MKAGRRIRPFGRVSPSGTALQRGRRLDGEAELCCGSQIVFVEDFRANGSTPPAESAKQGQLPRRFSMLQRAEASSRFAAPVHLKLFQDSVYVVLDRRTANPHRARDFLVRQPLTEQGKDLAFALRETR